MKLSDTGKRTLYAIYLGVGLSAFADLNFLDWKFYAIMIPTIFLVVAFNN
jgi:hypothetical protein